MAKANQLEGLPAVRMAYIGQEVACCLLYNQVTTPLTALVSARVNAIIS